jgi:hypothetical protein
VGCFIYADCSGCNTKTTTTINEVLTHRKYWGSHWNTQGLAWTNWVMRGETDWGASGYLPFWVWQPQQDHCNGTCWCDQAQLCNLQNAAKQTSNTASLQEVLINYFNTLT